MTKIQNSRGEWDVVLNQNNLEISEDVLKLLEASPGDKIFIEYLQLGGELKPVIGKSDDRGFKLSKSHTIPFKGKSNEFLAQYGTDFILVINGKLYELMGTKNPNIFTDTKKAADKTLSKDIISDTNFNISKFNNYEF